MYVCVWWWWWGLVLEKTELAAHPGSLKYQASGSVTHLFLKIMERRKGDGRGRHLNSSCALPSTCESMGVYTQHTHKVKKVLYGQLPRTP